MRTFNFLEKYIANSKEMKDSLSPVRDDIFIEKEKVYPTQTKVP